MAVVDPGVGRRRPAIAIEADGRWYVGPDNGLLSVVAARACTVRSFSMSWMPVPRTPSFHGRDLFAPAAARLARGDVEPSALEPVSAFEVDLGPGDLEQIIYLDHYGNAMTGIRAHALGAAVRARVGERSVTRERVFSDVHIGELFWYENSIGLVEIAANQSSAASILGLHVGQPVRIEPCA